MSPDKFIYGNSIETTDDKQSKSFLDDYEVNEARRKKLMLRKNHDYAGVDDPWKNMRRSEIIGIPSWLGIIIRNMDKSARIEELVLKEPAVTGEGLLDLFDDRSNYDNFAYTMYRNWLSRTTKEQRVEFLTALANMASILRKNP